MGPVIVEVTVRLEVIAPNAPAAAQAVIGAMNKAVNASHSQILHGGKWQVAAFEKPT